MKAESTCRWGWKALAPNNKSAKTLSENCARNSRPETSTNGEQGNQSHYPLRGQRFFRRRDTVRTRPGDRDGFDPSQRSHAYGAAAAGPGKLHRRGCDFDPEEETTTSHRLPHRSERGPAS